jgi:hypothetical protein
MNRLMNLFGFVHLGMAVVSTQGSARSALGYRNLGRRSPVSAIGLMRGGKACAPVSALLAARSAFNTPTGLI